MGCDIHAYVEQVSYCDKKTGEPTYWQFAKLQFSRDYNLFCGLAGVRCYPERGGDSDIPVQPRGLPDNVSDEIQEKYDDMASDAHSASWLTLAELEAVQTRYCNLMVAPASWYQLVPPPNDIVGDPQATTVCKEIRNSLGQREWYCETGERKLQGPSRDLAAVIAMMRELHAARFVFWFDN